MTKLILTSAAIELVTGIVLITVPSLAGRLLLGIELLPIACAVARLAGIALVALAIACWPQKQGAGVNAGAPLRGLLAYNALAAIYFCYWRVVFHSEGPLFWPAVVVHAIFAALFLPAVFAI